jgi:hypothetical protein
MRTWLIMIALAAIFAAPAAMLAAPAQAQVVDSTGYALASPPSEFEWGCFGPCACPVLLRGPLSGTFILKLSHTDPLYVYYDVLDVRWKVADATSSITITGNGTYRRGGEVAAQEQLTLDLSFNGAPSQHFDSGLRPLGATFPEINTRVSLHGEYCHDSVLAVDAKPVNVAIVDDGGATAVLLSAAPNPFSGPAAITFTLPRDAVVDLGVYDLAGRRIATLARREAFTRGSYSRSWDGRLANGALARAGLYIVRLESSAGRARVIIARL